jgi:hypothetical protein
MSGHSHDRSRSYPVGRLVTSVLMTGYQELGGERNYKMLNRVPDDASCKLPWVKAKKKINMAHHPKFQLSNAQYEY